MSTLAALVAGLLKLFTVTLAGAKAYNGRIKNMTEAIPAYADVQEELVDRFDAWSKADTCGDVQEAAEECES
ncbi:MAG: hypothetical protein IJV96_04970 [Clostridia bacterium]|nr:hypothetical protein [Clostridia bacterium]